MSTTARKSMTIFGKKWDSHSFTYTGESFLRKMSLMANSFGHFTDFEARPTCGIVTTEKIIGQLDDVRYIMESARMNAGIVWLSSGFLDYKVPNYLLSSDNPNKLEITMELASEAPGYNENWHSDITFHLNNVCLVWFPCLLPPEFFSFV
ncbi:hypothetical protein [Cohnella sp.]|uniref:hypothetical protein n=1 Tax=Cohnella sp. TaxID=1883426 RepID=UPI003569462E